MTVHEPFDGLERAPYRLKVVDYLLLDEAGHFDDCGRTELLQGEIFFMNAQHRPHARIKMHLYDALRATLAGGRQGLSVMVEASAALSTHDAPEPDLTLTTEPNGDGLIPGSSVALVIEVADATLSIDMGRKVALYASAGIAEYWVADVNGRTIHQMWSPSPGGFGERREIAFGSAVTAATIPNLTIDTTDL